MTDLTPLADKIRKLSMGYGAFIKLATPNKDGTENESNWYFNMRTTLTDSEGVILAGNAMADMLAAYRFDVIVGIAEGGLPLMTATQICLHHQGVPVRAVWLRKVTKEHGTGQLIEGIKKGERLDGLRAVIIEDLFTKGGSAAKAVEPIRALGAEVLFLAAIGDREEGADETFAELGVTYRSLFKLKELLPPDFKPITRIKQK